MIDLIDAARVLFMQEPTLLRLSAPITIIGDIHGQFYDMLEIFQIAGPAGQTQYLFLGDYVDRGSHSVEVILLLLCYKVLYPRRFHLIRGNHEDAKVCSNYGFSIEIGEKVRDFPREFWRATIDCFEAMPLAAVVSVSATQIFCVHAGLSPALHLLSQIDAIPRYCETPQNQQCIFSDLLWSDPLVTGAQDQAAVVFEKSSRGAGCVFGLPMVLKFCHENAVGHIMRSHQLQIDGYMVMFKDLLSTVWSAPYYTKKQNLASVCRLHGNGQRDYVVFEYGADFDNRELGLPAFQAIGGGFGGFW